MLHCDASSEDVRRAVVSVVVKRRRTRGCQGEVRRSGEGGVELSLVAFRSVVVWNQAVVQA